MKKDLKKIVMIGPVYPYKGGIAHYTGLMCKALRKKYDVTMGRSLDPVFPLRSIWMPSRY